MNAILLIAITIMIITVLLVAFGIEWNKDKNNNN
jgi:hypothetical protein